MSATAIKASVSQREIIDGLVARARDMGQALRERAAETEKNRTLSEATIREFQDAGFFKIMQPARYGGYELDYGPVQLELGEELGRWCGSSSWVALVLACHSWMIGMFPKQTQDEIWGTSPDALIASSIVAENGQAVPSPGGLTVSARWRFSSGVQFAQWAVLGLPMFGDNGPPEMTFCVIPRADFKIEDTWFVNGLRGTGSNDVVVDNLFVPEHRTATFGSLLEGEGAGGKVNASHIYRLPLFAVFPYNICAPALGIARGAFDLCIEQSRNKKPRPMAPPGMDPMFLRIADAGAQIDGARALLQMDAAELNDAARSGQPISAELRARVSRDLAYVTRELTEAVDSLYYLSGAHGLFDGDPMQRAFRDIHAINAHIGLRWEPLAATYVRSVLGLDGMKPGH
jgi:alkylation response protein AidB-like acyl-CoA dehydrogenase